MKMTMDELEEAVRRARRAQRELDELTGRSLLGGIVREAAAGDPIAREILCVLRQIATRRTESDKT